MLRSTGTLDISIVESPTDIEAVRQLSRDFFDWLITEFPEQRDKLRTYFDPRNWEKTLNALPSIHARPQGAILLARQDGLPVGCVMYHEMSPGVAEVKRLFVSTFARGRGTASHLLTALIESARADGYKELKLDTRTFLSAAEHLYRKHGFVDSGHKINLPNEAQDVVICLRRAL